MFVSHFPRFCVLSPCYRAYSVYFSFFMFFTVSPHIPGLTVCISFSTIFSVSRHILGPTSWFSQFPSWSVLLTYSRSYIVHFSFFTFFAVVYHTPGPTVCVYLIFHFFFSFLAIIQVLLFEFVIFLVGQFYRHIPGPTVCIFHFYLFQCFSPFSRSYILCVSFSTFLGFLTIPQFLHWAFLIFQVF